MGLGGLDQFGGDPFSSPLPATGLGVCGKVKRPVNILGQNPKVFHRLGDPGPGRTIAPEGRPAAVYLDSGKPVNNLGRRDDRRLGIARDDLPGE